MFYGIEGNTARRETGLAARYASCHNVSRAVSRVYVTCRRFYTSWRRELLR
jgi:hypothetical protein